MVQQINKSRKKPRHKYLSEDYYMVYRNPKTGRQVGVYNLTSKGKEVYAVGGVRGIFKTKTSAKRKAISLIK
jgi:hypothetical protein